MALRLGNGSIWTNGNDRDELELRVLSLTLTLVLALTLTELELRVLSAGVSLLRQVALAHPRVHVRTRVECT